MGQLPAFTHVAKQVADELGTVVGADHRTCAVRGAMLLHGASQRLAGVLGLTRRSAVGAYDDTGKHNDNAQDKEMPVQARHVPVLNVHLPELARSSKIPVLRQFQGMLKALMTAAAGGSPAPDTAGSSSCD